MFSAGAQSEVFFREAGGFVNSGEETQETTKTTEPGLYIYMTLDDKTSHKGQFF